MTRRNAVLAVVFFLASFPAAAAPTDFRIFLDVDTDVATGCSVPGMDGVDQVLVTRVVSGDAEAEVTRTFRQVCTNGVLGGETDVTTTHWPAGFNAGNGDILVETRLPFAATGELDSLRIGISVGNGTVHTETLEAHETIAAKAAAPVGRRRSASAPPRTFILDGIGSDWAGIEPLIDGIAASGTPSLRILKFFAYANDADDHYYFRFDANLTDDAPYANDDDFVRPAGEGLSISAAGVLSNDGDPLGSALVALPVSPATHGEVILNPDGSFTYTPDDPASTQNDSFEYRASNGAKTSASAVVRINVHTVGNAAPFGNADTYETGEDELLTVAAPGVLQNDTDADADVLTAALLAAPAHGSVVLAANGGFTYTPSEEFTGSDAFTYTVSDGTESSTATVTIYVGGSNDVPSVSPGTFSVAENSASGTVVGDVDAIDNDATDTHRFSIAGGNSGNAFAIDPQTGVITVAGALNFETLAQYSLVVRATDSGMPPRADEETITIRITNVNERPVITSAGSFTNEDKPVAVTLSANDPEGAPLTFTISGGATAGTITGTAPDELIYTPPQDFHGTAFFPYTVSDGENHVHHSHRITVFPVHDPPVAQPDHFTVAEGEILQAWNGGVLNNDTAIEGSMTVILVSGPSQAWDFFLRPHGDFSYHHNGSEGSSDSFVYKISDGTKESKPVTVTIAVTPVNDPPAAMNDGFSLSEGGTLNEAAGVLANDTDPEKDGLTVSLIQEPAFAAAFTLHSDGTFSYTHDGSETSDDYFQYSVTDGVHTSTALVTLTITPVNDPVMVTAAPPATTEEDTSSGLGLSVSDPDGVHAPLRVTIQAVNGTVSIRPQAGLTFLQGDGIRDALVEFTGTAAYVQNAVLLAGFTPVADFAGEATITLTADDGASTASATHSITMTPLNDDPWVHAPGALTLAEDAPVAFEPGSLFISEPDGPAARVKVSIAFNGATATFGESDGVTVTHEWNEIALTGTVEKVNAALASMTLTLPANTAGSRQLDIYAYDLGDFGDLTPNSVGSSWAYVVLTIVPVNDAPVNTLPATLETAENVPVGIGADVNDVEAEDGTAVMRTTLSVTNGTLHIGSASPAISGNGTSTLTLNGTWLLLTGLLDYVEYHPAPGFSGTVQLTMTTNDRDTASTEGALEDVDVLEITVTPVNDPVVASAWLPATVDEDTNVLAGLGVRDDDGAQSLLHITIQGVHATVTFFGTKAGLTFLQGDGGDDAFIELTGTVENIHNALGSLQVTPEANFVGEATVTLTANDGFSTSTATRSITTTPINDDPLVYAPQSFTLVEDTPVPFEPGSVFVTDPDGATARVKVVIVFDGSTVTFGETEGVTINLQSYPEVSGPVDKVNAALASMTILPSKDLTGSRQFDIQAYDLGDFGGFGGGSWGWGMATVYLTILPVNDPPVNTLPAALETTENSPLEIAAWVRDYEWEYEWATLEVTLSVTNGTLQVGGSEHTITGNGTSMVTLRGNYGAVNNNALDSFIYTPAPGFIGTVQLTMTSNDLDTDSAEGALQDTDVLDITVTPAAP